MSNLTQLLYLDCFLLSVIISMNRPESIKHAENLPQNAFKNFPIFLPIMFLSVPLSLHYAPSLGHERLDL